MRTLNVKNLLKFSDSVIFCGHKLVLTIYGLFRALTIASFRRYFKVIFWPVIFALNKKWSFLLKWINQYVWLNQVTGMIKHLATFCFKSLWMYSFTWVCWIKGLYFKYDMILVLRFMHNLLIGTQSVWNWWGLLSWFITIFQVS